MNRALVLVLAPVLGCNASYVAAVAEDTGGGASGTGSASSGVAVGTSSSTGAGDSSSTGTPEDSSSEGTTGTLCAPPSSLPDCDAAADPLRAPEILCYENVAAANFASLDPDAWRRARELGNAHWVSTESEALLVLSTGLLPEPGIVGEVNVDPGAGELASADNDNPNGVPLPAGIDPSFGSTSATPYADCDGQGDSSGTLATAFAGSADDLVWFTFDATVPDGVRGYALRVGFLSAAYPEDLGTDVSDLFVWWHESEAYVGNLATWQGRPATVSGLGQRMHEFAGDHPMLLRTGVDGRTGELCEVEGKNVNCPVGASTGWMELRGPAEPGETLHIVAALLDQSALQRDTLVALDGFAWTCEGCTAGQDCGFQ